MIIFSIHVYGRRAVKNKGDEESVDTIRRVYLFFMLIVCSLIGLITLPMAIYQSIHYQIADRHYRYINSIPSTAIAVALVFVALWIFYMIKVLKETRQNNNGKLPT